MEEAAAAAASYNNTYYYCYYFLIPLLFFSIFNLTSGRRGGGRKLPPSPRGGLPILGHMRLLKQPLHRTLAAMADDIGPIFTLRLGSQRAVVVSSASLAEECFTKNDIVFANRPHLTLGKHMEYNNTTVMQAPYGDHWRNLRRIGAVEIFSTHRVNAFISIRREEAHRLVAHLAAARGPTVELKSAFHQLSFNTMTRMVAGKSYYGGGGSNDDDVARQFVNMMEESAELGGASNDVDFVPVLRWLDGGKFERKVKDLSRRMDDFFQKLIDEHKSNKEGTLENSNTMIDRLLTLQESQPEYYNDEIVKGLALTLLLAGTDTTAITLEWVMSHLLNHPKVLAKAREEIDKQIGSERLIEESDIPNLPYLQNIISESLRLYPAGPLLVPHISSDDCTVGGYHVPRDTLLMVNAWAIHRDPKVWEDPTRFRPERHEGRNGGSVKEGGKFMAFGMGRRACPGEGLGLRIVDLTLGTLIQCFEWERVGEEEVDMTEGFGLTIPKVKPLEAVCVARPIVNKIIAS